MERLERFMRERVDSDMIDREGKIPSYVVRGLGEIGAFGIKIPTEYGGLGLSQYSYTRAIGLVTSEDGNLTALLSAAQSIGVPTPLKLFGTPEQKKQYLPRLARGAVSAFALTENQRRLRSRGPRDHGDALRGRTHYILNGEKLWCTNGTIAELLVVMARTGPKQITAFIVETDWPGVEVVQRLHFMGLKAIENGIIRFTNVKVPVENVLWGEGKGLKLALITLNTGRLTLPASAVAGSKRASSSRGAGRRSGCSGARRSASTTPSPRSSGRMAADIFAMEAVSDLASLLADRGNADIRLEAAMAKMWNTEIGWRIIDDTLQIKGGRGYETADSLRSRGRAAGADRADDARLPHQPDLRGLQRDHAALHRPRGGGHPPARRGRHHRPEGVDGEEDQGAAPLRRRTTPTGIPSSSSAGAARPATASSAGSPAHVRFVDRSCRRLARTLFHCMVRFGPKLEKRQAVLGRLVEIGAELLAMTAACSRARARRWPTAGRARPRPGPVELADVFCRHARRRVRGPLRGASSTTTTSRPTGWRSRCSAGEHGWLETGMVRTAEER